ncbi:hypothetical protein JCM30394_36130 [Deferrisoma palaeochoriense]
MWLSVYLFRVAEGSEWFGAGAGASPELSGCPEQAVGRTVVLGRDRPQHRHRHPAPRDGDRIPSAPRPGETLKPAL